MTITMNHADIQPLLADYRDLRGDERRAVDDHVSTCASCARTLADYQSMDANIQALRDAPADPRLRARYQAGLAGKDAPRKVAVPRPARYALAAVAVMLVMYVGVLELGRRVSTVFDTICCRLVDPDTRFSPTAAAAAAGTPQRIVLPPTDVAPTPDPRLIVWPTWQAFEQALGNAFLGARVGNRVCDWTLLGRDGNDFYVWAHCAAFNPAPEITAASMPAVLRVSENNTAVGALIPRDGTLWPEDVRTLFPPAVQQQIFDRAFEPQLPALEQHARLRLIWPELPALGAAEVAPADPDAPGADASIRIFSGRPDPNWTLTQRDLLALDGYLRELDTIQCPPIPDRLGYRGVSVDLGPGDVGTLVAAEGNVWSGEAVSNPDALCLADPDRTVERFLLGSSQPYVEADVFNLIAPLIEQPIPTPLATPAPTPTLAPNWVMFGDEGLDIQLRHPDVWEVGTATDYSRVWETKAASINGGQLEAPAVPPPFWLTILPQNYDNADAAAYNFWDAASIAQAWDTPVGETFVSSHAPEGYNTYTRLPDITVDGFPAAVVESERVWGMSAETKDVRVLTRIGGMTVAFGAYYADEAAYVTFGRVLESVKFGSGLIAAGAASTGPQPVPAAAPIEAATPEQ
jgi:hypothetical protein